MLLRQNKLFGAPPRWKAATNVLFDDHGAFVRYAQERKLALDFTTPPRRRPL